MDKTTSEARPLADKLIVVQRYEKNMNNLFLVDEIKTNNCETQNLLFKMVLLYKKASKQPEDIMKILMIEDNVSVCTMTEMFFFKEGFEAEFVHDGLEGYQRFTEENWDLIILDIMLPSMDGVTICRKIRETSTVPIIMLTAKDTESDQVIGFEMGADDYVTKPFSPLTLVARIKAVIRRYKATGKAVIDEDMIETECFTINKKTREVLLNGEPVENLTPKEFDLLYYLVQNPRQVFSREQLLEQVWGYQFYGDERTVDVHIKRLRKKLASEDKPFLYTVWGVGYKFDED
ncbi:Transcriptional regulatory protein SrrA [Bacillus subtilis]|nr:Autoinducer 2 sensor kinase/phosphatase LuxQ [Bacillus subtilis subsp. subtilis]QHM07399.1 Transcriptional regulatory protein SrrA [Bacillus subtilis]QHM12921.1 Transcriptional regulatory protein SrrA [Bacillus subtilis]CJR86833.1 essential two-component response regulator [Streptococcus pneumoniae]COO21825.1 essential two-component response regulator [Bacillus subtilis]